MADLGKSFLKLTLAAFLGAVVGQVTPIVGRLLRTFNRPRPQATIRQDQLCAVQRRRRGGSSHRGR